VVRTSDFSNLRNLNISFFANILARTNDLSAVLFGDRNLAINDLSLVSGAQLTLRPGLAVGWTSEMHNDNWQRSISSLAAQGNSAMNDGSVQQFTTKRLRERIQESQMSTNLLLIP